MSATISRHLYNSTSCAAREEEAAVARRSVPPVHTVSVAYAGFPLQIDTSRNFFKRGRLFEYPKHREFLRRRCRPPHKEESDGGSPSATIRLSAPGLSTATPTGWRS